MLEKPGISAVELFAQDFPDIDFVIDDLLPTGFCVLAGKSKSGKSWLVLNWAIAVASGKPALGCLPVAPGPVLYIANEDDPRRLKNRLCQILVNSEPPSELTFIPRNHWPLLDKRDEDELTGLDHVRMWLSSVKNPKLVIIDTLSASFSQDSRSRKKPLLKEDYDLVRPLMDLANSCQIALILVHHTRKQDAEDAMDLISGSTGFMAASDTAMVLKRKRGRNDAELHVATRQFEDPAPLSLQFSGGIWTVLSCQEGPRLSEHQSLIIKTLESVDGPLGPKELASATGIAEGTVGTLVRRLNERGDILNPERGKYTVKTVRNVSTDSLNRSHSDDYDKLTGG